MRYAWISDGTIDAKTLWMAEAQDNWKDRVRVQYQDGKLTKYSIAFYRMHESGWYDEIRLDSHEMKKGRKTLAPHFHMKLHCGFQDLPEHGVERITRVIDNQLEALREVIQ